MNSAGFVYELIEVRTADGQLPDDALAPGSNEGSQHTKGEATDGAWRRRDFTAWPGHGQFVHCAHTLRAVAVLAVASTLARQPGANRGLVLFRRATARAA